MNTSEGSSLKTSRFSPHILRIFFGVLILSFLGSALFFLLPFFADSPEVSSGFVSGVERDIASNGSFLVSFTEPMNRKSVENAFLLSPSLDGDFEWESNAAFRYVPKNSLTEGDRITLTIAPSAKSHRGKELLSEVQLIYRVVSPPKISLITPIDSASWRNVQRAQSGEEGKQIPETTLIRPGQPVTVLFDRPIHALGEESATTLQQFLTTDPPVSGEFRFLGTSAFEFRINEEQWPVAQEITMTLHEGFPTEDGGKTLSGASWKLKTPVPKLVSVRTGNISFSEDSEENTFHAEHISPNSTLVLTWSDPVELGSFYEHFSITPDRYSQQKDQAMDDILIQNPENPKEIILDFDPPLVREENIVLHISTGISPRSGDLPTEESYSISFQTLRDPCFSLVNDDGNQTSHENIRPGSSVTLEFCTLMTYWDEKKGEEKNQSEDMLRHLSLTPEIDPKDISVSCSGTQCSLTFPKTPQTEYSLSLSEGLTDVFGQPISSEKDLSVSVGDYAPFLTVMTRGDVQGVYRSDQPASVYLSARNVDNVRFVTCEIPEEKVRQIEGEGGWGWYQFSCVGNPTRKEKNIPVPGTPNELITFEAPLEEANARTPFLFWEASSTQVVDSWSKKPFVFSGVAFRVNASLTIKTGSSKALVWMTDFTSGAPVSGAKVKLSGSDGKTFAEGTTDATGIASFSLSEEHSRFFAMGQKDELFAVAGTEWSRGISNWDFGIPFDWNSFETRTIGTTFTDRPIYRPGDTVQFKAILRDDRDVLLSLPKAESVRVRIENSQGEEVINELYPISSSGTLNGSFSTPDSAPTGRYFLFVTKDKEEDWITDTTFWMEEYQKPPFRVNITSAQKEYVSGDDFSATINTSYFFDAPLPNARISWHVVETDLSFDRWKGEGWYSFGNEKGWCEWGCEENQEVRFQGEGVTDENGMLAIHFPLKLSENRLLTLRVTAVDAEERTVSESATFPAFSSAFVFGVRSDQFFLDDTDETVSANVIASDTNGNLLSGKKFSAKLLQVTWNSIQKQDVDGNFYWESAEETKELETASGTTNVGGKTDISFSLQKSANYYGQLRILVEWEDDRGNTGSSSDSVWRSSAEYPSPWRRENNDRISLQSSELEVKPGESITILPESPFAEEAYALITVERRNVLQTQVTKLLPGQPIILQTTEDMIPNVFVSVILSKGKGKLGEAENMIRERKDVKENIGVLSEKITALMRQQEELSKKLVETGDSAEVGIQKAISSVAQQIQTISQEKKSAEEKDASLTKTIEELFGSKDIPELGAESPRPEMKMGMIPVRVSPESRRLSLTITSGSEEYLPGEEAELYFLVTTADGDPVGNADLSIAVVDESLLALKTRENEDPFAVFYALRDLGVRTAHSLVYFINRIDVTSQKGEKGGGGGEDLEILRKRRGDFRDTAFWQAELKTDASGKATATFTLPDNVTTWQAWATANTPDSRFGSAKENFVSQKPLFIEPITPRFFVAGDTALIGALVHNGTEDERIIGFNFSAENAEVLRKDTESFTLSAGESRSLWFLIRAEANKENRQGDPLPINLHFSARGDAERAIDSIDWSIPVKAPILGESFATNGILSGENVKKTESLLLSKNTLQNAGSLFLSVFTGLGENFFADLDSLIHYPYGCAEQIMSAHIPNVLLWRLYQEKNSLLSPEKKDELEKNIREGIQRILPLQQSDGGFALWKDSEKSLPYLSSYILFGLEQTRLSGFSVDEQALDNLREYVWNILKTPPLKNSPDTLSQWDTMAFAAYALSEGIPFDLSLFSVFAGNTDKLTSEGKSFLLLALLSRDFSEEAAQKLEEKLTTEIEASVVQTDRDTFLPGGSDANFGSDIRSTAIGFLALKKANPDHPLLPKFLSYLRGQKKSPAEYLGGAWGSTQSTSWALLAFLEILKDSSTTETEIRGLVNLSPVLSATLSSETPETTGSVPVSDLILNSKNSIDISSSTGTAYYDIVANTFIPAEDVTEKNNGFGIVRAFFRTEDKEEKTPVFSAKKGELLRGKISLLVPENRNYVGITIPLPAGLEGINFALETEDESLKSLINSCDFHWCPENDLWYFGHREFRDDHIFLFADWLPQGRYEFEFLARATTEGEFRLLPAKAEQIYRPEVFGTSEGDLFIVDRASE
ncbi:hypothetical protein IPN35_04985 [Candidatus Peregrinibacteria bacterium]|nr:MAG: hypothetical protein IPN35_04985 [Candidatus Peregrinibacteria bacterium]